MSPLVRLRAAATSLWGTLTGSAPEQLPDGVPALTAPMPAALTRATVESVRLALEDHENGSFQASGALATHLLRDADLQAALRQRVLAVQGLPFCMRPADDTRAAAQLAVEAEALWPRMVSAGAVADAISDTAMMGFFVGVVRYRYDEDAGQVLPHLEPWPTEYVYCQNGQWFACAAEGVFPITPGDGRWVLWTPASERMPYAYGAVRCLSPWVLRGEYAGRDASRWSETKGQGVWLARLPTMQAETPEGMAFVRSVRNMGRAPVVPLPQGQDPSQSFGLDLVESKSDGWQGFEFLGSAAARRVRLAILGQDMTSVSGSDGGSYAQSKVGNTVRQDVTEADAGFGAVVREQMMAPWARLRAARPDRAPWPWWDATPPEDLAELANAQNTAGTALTTWVTAGVPVDAEAYAARFGMPLRAADESTEARAARILRAHCGPPPRRTRRHG